MYQNAVTKYWLWVITDDIWVCSHDTNIMHPPKEEKKNPWSTLFFKIFLSTVFFFSWRNTLPIVQKCESVLQLFLRDLFNHLLRAHWNARGCAASASHIHYTGTVWELEKKLGAVKLDQYIPKNPIWRHSEVRFRIYRIILIIYSTTE